MIFTPTDEQSCIILSNANCLKVRAGAGSGKTRTLLEYAKEKRGMRMLYIVFNRSVMLEAQDVMPRNVTVVTGHKLAYQAFGHKYKDRLVGNLNPYELIDNEMIEFHGNKEEAYVFGFRVVEVLTNFLASKEDEVNKYCLGSDIRSIENRFYPSDLIVQARKMWALMQDENSGFSVTHDAYLKMYHLSDPKLNMYDCIMFDEAQDANPVLLDIVEKQRGRKVFVGDEHQAIYGFRKAIDAISKIDADEELMLSRSFRFGENIAATASYILEEFKGSSFRVHGCREQDSINAPFTTGKDDVAYIMRNNSNIFAQANEFANRDIPIKFVGGVDGYRFGDILELNKFKETGNTSHHLFRSFEDYDQICEIAKSTRDISMLSMVGTINRFGNSVVGMAGSIFKAQENKHEHPVTFSTAHKSKGLEFDNVVLGEDFFDVESDKIDPEEVNLLYVAASRAKKNIVLNDGLNHHLSQIRQHVMTTPPQPKSKSQTIKY